MVPSPSMLDARSIDVTESVELASAPEDVWPFVSDTDRTNRIVTGAPVTYEPIEDDAPPSSEPPSRGGARFVGHTRAGGFAMTYEELPFEWTHGKSFRVVRKMRGGLIASYALSWSLEPSKKIEGGTRATVRLELAPRYGVLKPIAYLQGRGFVRRLAEFAEQVDAHVRERAPSPFRIPVSSANAFLVEQGVAQIIRAGVRPELAARIAAYLRDAADADLVRVRPFELADTWKVDRRELLTAMLRAVPAGLFELRWAVVCPSCRTASEQAGGLEEISEEGHCQLCDISFELELDRAVEATFIPHRAVRDVPNQMFCIGGPARTPHVLAQVNVDHQGTAPLEAPGDPGRYRIFARGGAIASVEVEPGAPTAVAVAVRDEGIRPVDVHIAPHGTIALTNETRESRHVKIEKLGYASAAVTAHFLSTVSEFRRLFSGDLLKRGTPLKVTRVAILFSDLTGSTALYTRVGDAAAFRLVDDHFDVVRAAVERHDGVVVKTMGDAVMAAFPEPRACVRAAVESLREFERFRVGREHGDLVGIKLGMFDGPCYVVTANGRLDYFGQTVNVASRVQHLAQSGELVLAHDAWTMLGDDERRMMEQVERFEARVKGVDTPLDLVRLRVATRRERRSQAPPAPAAHLPRS